MTTGVVSITDHEPDPIREILNVEEQPAAEIGPGYGGKRPGQNGARQQSVGTPYDKVPSVGARSLGPIGVELV